MTFRKPYLSLLNGYENSQPVSLDWIGSGSWLKMVDENVQEALKTERTIDIVTIGAKSGLPRRTEIWFSNINGRIIICGTPSADGRAGHYTPRDWLANLRAHPSFTFCLKGSVTIELPAKAVEITDPVDRLYVMSAPETQWYRDQVESIDVLVKASPIVEVFFER